ncbi:MAG: glycine cleavage system aminomethyltransferase GcvT [Elusimicrobiota bacterium]
MKHTALYEIHRALGAKFAPFAGFEMPIVYKSILDEHRAVRAGAGIFDVSHMGQIFVAGPDSCKFLDYLLTNDISAPPIGSAIYAHMPNDRGGVIDDLIVYKLSERNNLLVVNASRIDADWEWIKKHAEGFTVEISDESPHYGIVAIQGPLALKISAQLHPKISEIQKMKVSVIPWKSHDIIAARTGYTGEDGFELIAENEIIAPLWQEIARLGPTCAGAFSPCGLGARDTLRLEAGFPLWGHELSEDITSLESGYSWVINWNKPSFKSKNILERQKQAGLSRKIFGFAGASAGPVPRQGSLILTKSAQKAGIITSGSFSPTLGKPIAMGFVDKAYWNETNFILDTGGRQLQAQTVKLPFYNK